MSTFREIALAKIEEARDDLAMDGLLDDKAGALAGAMVDAATIAVQDWLRNELAHGQRTVDLTIGRGPTIAELIREAGKVAQ